MPPEHGTNPADRAGHWSAGGLSTEHALAHGIRTTPGVVSAAAFALVASRPWTRSNSASDSPPQSSS
jgi:hypothetical protein